MSAKMVFLEFREERNWTIQGVVAVSAEGKPVISKRIVIWIGSLKLESFVTNLLARRAPFTIRSLL